MRIKRRSIDERTDTRQQAEPFGCERPSEEIDAAVVRFLQAKEKADRRRFARAVRSQESIDALRRDIQTDSTHGVDASVRLSNIFEMDDWRVHSGLYVPIAFVLTAKRDSSRPDSKTIAKEKSAP